MHNARLRIKDHQIAATIYVAETDGWKMVLGSDIAIDLGVRLIGLAPTFEELVDPVGDTTNSVNKPSALVAQPPESAIHPLKPVADPPHIIAEAPYQVVEPPISVFEPPDPIDGPYDQVDLPSEAIVTTPERTLRHQAYVITPPDLAAQSAIVPNAPVVNYVDAVVKPPDPDYKPPNSDAQNIAPEVETSISVLVVGPYESGTKPPDPALGPSQSNILHTISVSSTPITEIRTIDPKMKPPYLAGEPPDPETTMLWSQPSSTETVCAPVPTGFSPGTCSNAVVDSDRQLAIP